MHFGALISESQLISRGHCFPCGEPPDLQFGYLLGDTDSCYGFDRGICCPSIWWVILYFATANLVVLCFDLFLCERHFPRSLWVKIGIQRCLRETPAFPVSLLCSFECSPQSGVTTCGDACVQLLALVCIGWYSFVWPVVLLLFFGSYFCNNFDILLSNFVYTRCVSDIYLGPLGYCYSPNPLGSLFIPNPLGSYFCGCCFILLRRAIWCRLYLGAQFVICFLLTTTT